MRIMPGSPSSRPRLKPVPAVRVPDSRHKIYPTKVIAEDHELEGRGGPGYLKIRPPKLEARAETLERRRGDLRCTPEISGDHQSRDVRRSIIEYLKVDGKANQVGCYRVGRESHVGNGKSRLHLDFLPKSELFLVRDCRRHFEHRFQVSADRYALSTATRSSRSPRAF